MKSLKFLKVAIENSVYNYGNEIYHCVLKNLSFFWTLLTAAECLGPCLQTREYIRIGQVFLSAFAVRAKLKLPIKRVESNFPFYSV